MSERTLYKSNVAVVGGAGFLGSHLVNFLIQERCANVLVIDNLCVGKKQHIEWALENGAIFEHADIAHSESYLYRVFKALQIDYVFNYAAHPYIPVSFDRPAHVFATNATGALNVINAAHEAGCKGILQVSSAEIYGDGTEPKLDEDTPVTPHSSYGASKAAIDFLVQCRWKEAEVPCISLRQFNCVGERETHPYIVPEIISQLSSQIAPKPDMSATIQLGNNSFRDFLYAGDAVAMAVELLENGQFGEVYNLGSEAGIRMYDLARLIGEEMGFSEVNVVQDPKRVRPWEIWYLLSNNSKIYSVVNHRPKVGLREALKRTIQSFYENGCKWGWE